MKVEDIRKLSNEDINKKITESKKELFDLRMKQATGSLEKPSMMSSLKKTIARMKTVLKERELESGAENGK